MNVEYRLVCEVSTMIGFIVVNPHQRTSCRLLGTIYFIRRNDVNKKFYCTFYYINGSGNSEKRQNDASQVHLMLKISALNAVSDERPQSTEWLVAKTSLPFALRQLLTSWTKSRQSNEFVGKKACDDILNFVTKTSQSNLHSAITWFMAFRRGNRVCTSIFLTWMFLNYHVQ